VYGMVVTRKTHVVGFLGGILKGVFIRTVLVDAMLDITVIGL
jgi:hypothetical protein